MLRVLFAFVFFGLLTSTAASAQTRPAHPTFKVAQDSTPEIQRDRYADAMPLADYLGLLRQIAPAAEAGTKDYLAAFERRCGRTLSTTELRRAMSQGDGDPVLMRLIRASYQRDSAAREQLTGQIACPGKGAP